MKYLHEKNISEKFIRHWANEDASDEDTESTYKVRQIETGILYDDAFDLIPCRYTYEATDEPVKTESEAEENDYMTALERFGVRND